MYNIENKNDIFLPFYVNYTFLKSLKIPIVLQNQI